MPVRHSFCCQDGWRTALAGPAFSGATLGAYGLSRKTLATFRWSAVESGSGRSLTISLLSLPVKRNCTWSSTGGAHEICGLGALAWIHVAVRRHLYLWLQTRFVHLYDISPTHRATFMLNMALLTRRTSWVAPIFGYSKH
jgi:hypothetical protein